MRSIIVPPRTPICPSQNASWPIYHPTKIGSQRSRPNPSKPRTKPSKRGLFSSKPGRQPISKQCSLEPTMRGPLFLRQRQGPTNPAISVRAAESDPPPARARQPPSWPAHSFIHPPAAARPTESRNSVVDSSNTTSRIKRHSFMK